MKLTHSQADLFVPDSKDASAAFARTTHLGVGAHQDDLEFMAPHGILECLQQENKWFGGVTCTDGAGSSRSGPYADYTDAEMKAVRIKEQKTAATIGQYGFIAQLAHPSSTAKDASRRHALVDDLESIFKASKPDVVYTHNPFDKHATHIGVLMAVLAAIHRLPKTQRPRQLFGCEVWRGLDWLPDTLKVVHNADAHPNLIAALNGVFDSQITGGKRYDLAVEGRRLANATFFDSHSIDKSQSAIYSLDLTTLINEEEEMVADYCKRVLGQFQEEVTAALSSVS